MRWLPADQDRRAWSRAGGDEVCALHEQREAPAAPAVMLEGSSERIVGCAVMVTAADAERLESSALAATMLRVLGDGMVAGASYSPVGSIVPHGEPAALHAAPVIVQVTCWLVVPATLAVKFWLAPGASVTLGGKTLTTTCGMMVMALLCALRCIRLADHPERHRVRRRYGGRSDVIDAAGIC